MNSKDSDKIINFKERAPLGYLIHELARLMKRRFEEEARAHGITLSQWRALGHVAQVEGITQVALAQGIDADPMTVSGILDRLEKRGLIERYPDPTDSRAKLARLTPAGTALYNTAKHVGSTVFQTALAGVTPEHRDIAQAVLQRMRENLAGQAAEHEEA